MFIDYSTGPRIVNEGSHVVYARAAWDAAWTEQPNLKALECQWNAAPAMNVALLRWDMGYVILPGDSDPTLFGPWVGRGQFIRIDWTCDDGSLLRWVGFVDSSDWPTEAYGAQTIVCYGLEQALAKTPMSDIVWRDVDHDSLDDPQPGLARRSQFPLTFNAADGRMSFDPVEADGDVYAFAAATEDNPRTWSTRDIVRYLVNYHLPSVGWMVDTVPWEVTQIEQLPDWDAPMVETRNRTLWDVLTELISPDKQLGFTVGSDGTTAYLRCFTHLASTLTIGSQSIAANPNQHSLQFAPDALTDARLADVGGGYDQVIVRGARRQTICTLNYILDHLASDWTNTLQAQYDTAASTEAGYGALSVALKQQHNAAVRAQPLLSTVFRRFKIAPDWNFEVGAEVIFTDNPYPRSVRLLPRLPIKSGVDWSGTIDPDKYDRDGEGRPFLLHWEDPTGQKLRIDNSGLEQLSATLGPTLKHDFTVRPFVDGRRLDLVVDGGPQYLIAAGEFSPLAVDSVPILEYRQIELTVAIEEDRFCEGVYPTAEPTADIVRRLVLDLGDAYNQIRVHAGTVTEISTFSGVRQTSSGGYLVDDSAQLAALARIIADSVLLSRKTVSWSSLRKISTIAVGDLITTAAGQAIVAPVTAVHIRGGVSLNAPAGATQQAFEVYRGTMDPLAVVRRLGGTKPGVKIT